MSEIGDDDKRQFFEDGFLIVRNAVSSELVARAKALIQEGGKLHKFHKPGQKILLS